MKDALRINKVTLEQAISQITLLPAKVATVKATHTGRIEIMYKLGSDRTPHRITIEELITRLSAGRITDASTCTKFADKEKLEAIVSREMATPVVLFFTDGFNHYFKRSISSSSEVFRLTGHQIAGMARKHSQRPARPSQMRIPDIDAGMNQDDFFTMATRGPKSK